MIVLTYMRTKAYILRSIHAPIIEGEVMREYSLQKLVGSMRTEMKQKETRKGVIRLK